MEIAVVGGGHGCYAAAADLSERGHRVRLWRRARSVALLRHLDLLPPPVEAGGA